MNKMSNTKAALPLSVIIVAEGDGKGLVGLFERYRAVLDGRGQDYEVILVLDNRASALRDVAAQIAEEWPNVAPLSDRPWTGEDTAIKLGVDRAIGDVILTLPAWSEIDPEGINVLIDAVGENDMVSGRRTGLERSSAQKLRAKTTHWLLRALFQHDLDDVFCRARAGKREVFLRSTEMGVRQHFQPLISASEGYRVQEVDVAVDTQAIDKNFYRFKPQAHIGALADIFTLFIGLKFLKRPLRFFGAIGMPLVAIGALISLVLIFERLLFGTALADRPALVFGISMLVLGIQIVALGLVGEIIIFSSSRRMRSYDIDKIIRGMPTEEELDALGAAKQDTMAETHDNKSIQ